jgi:hypothetical protein
LEGNAYPGELEATGIRRLGLASCGDNTVGMEISVEEGVGEVAWKVINSVT